MPAVNSVNAEADQDSLRKAMDRIIGTTPGTSGGWGQGESEGGWGGKPAPESAVQLPVRDAASTMSAKLETPTAYDPGAESQAAFDKQMAELKAWSPTGTSTSANTAANAQAAAAAAAPIMGYDDFAKQYKGSGDVGLEWSKYYLAAPRSTPLSQAEYVASQNTQLEKRGYGANSMTPQLSDIGYQSYLSSYAPDQLAAFQAEMKARPAASAPLKKPVYPGGGGQGVDWRVTAQYWKDLEAYNKSIGRPINER